ncbi:MAG TPA: tRNA epoxyqueuosine(34) reductase QueG [Dongiaceae bacterium]|nr:tRNA epoxyqueuosine(34) reductase QueG [Dongiaceae bacterium]
MLKSTASESQVLVKELARLAGFDLVGIARIEDIGEDKGRVVDWVSAGRHGTMDYMSRNTDRRLDPGRILPGARSVVCVALNYGESPSDVAPGHGRIARYARGRDYHKIFIRRLTEFERRLHERFPGISTRHYVDTGPVLEKLWAERAGLGWRGKHTNLVSREWGSWLLLGEVLIDLDLEPDARGEDHCGTCTRCLDACPTNAFPAPYQLDANRCLSYLTIEHRGSIPVEFREALGDRVFGCDDCLDACPWNRFAREAREVEFRPRPELIAPLLTELVAMDDAEFLRRFAGTAVMRAKREGLARNACVALGNIGGPSAREALTKALSDPSAIVREHAAWAIAKLEA